MRGHDIIKGVYVRLVLGYQESRKFKLRQGKATVDAPGCDYSHPLSAIYRHSRPLPDGVVWHIWR